MSHLLVDLEDELNMPGGPGFIDTTDILKRGTEDLKFGTILAVDGFTLQDAMSALEIMDPRMDTGMVEPPPPFDPHTPLLPSEVCWILDRSFACEMSWHTGLALSQTVYTLQYVHHLSNVAHPGFDSDHATWPSEQSDDSERPMELVTLVLRAGVFGLMKCCDLVWRELACDHLVDGEDWNGEKFGVSLCEGVQAEALMRLLDDAVHWLEKSSSISSSPWRDPLLQRILLRKNIFQTLAYPSFPALSSAELNLGAILNGPSSPEPSVAVKNSFDPAIARRLVSFVPTRVVDMPPQVEVWEAISMWLDGWQEVRRLIGAEDLRSVKVLANTRACEGPSPRRSAFLRSLSISTFFNGQKILLSHDPPWLIDRFFWETAAVDAVILSQLNSQLSEGGKIPSTPSEDREKIVELFEKGLAKLLVDLFSSSFHNRARQRRRLADSLLDWHLAYDQASAVVKRLTFTASLRLDLSRVPLCIRHTRIYIITEIVFSGFELELYTPDEWAMMYWYTERLLTTQVAILDELQSSISRDSNLTNPYEAQSYVSFQLEYAEALRRFSFAMRDVMYRYAPAKANIDAPREQGNFERRFKWAFIEGYSEAFSLDEDLPVLDKWREWKSEQEISDDDLSEAVSNLVGAQEAFSRLSEHEPLQSGSVFCPDAYKEFMAGLVRTCDANLTFLRTAPEIRKMIRQDWHWRSSRWFPEVSSSQLTT